MGDVMGGLDGGLGY